MSTYTLKEIKEDASHLLRRFSPAKVQDLNSPFKEAVKMAIFFDENKESFLDGKPNEDFLHRLGALWNDAGDSMVMQSPCGKWKFRRNFVDGTATLNSIQLPNLKTKDDYIRFLRFLGFPIPSTLTSNVSF